MSESAALLKRLNKNISFGLPSASLLRILDPRLWYPLRLDLSVAERPRTVVHGSKYQSTFDEIPTMEHNDRSHKADAKLSIHHCRALIRLRFSIFRCQTCIPEHGASAV